MQMNGKYHLMLDTPNGRVLAIIEVEQSRLVEVHKPGEQPYGPRGRNTDPIPQSSDFAYGGFALLNLHEMYTEGSSWFRFTTIDNGATVNLVSQANPKIVGTATKV